MTNKKANEITKATTIGNIYPSAIQYPIRIFSIEYTAKQGIIIIMVDIAIANIVFSVTIEIIDIIDTTTKENNRL